jgi:hypothetical protein
MKEYNGRDVTSPEGGSMRDDKGGGITPEQRRIRYEAMYRQLRGREKSIVMTTSKAIW